MAILFVNVVNSLPSFGEGSIDLVCAVIPAPDGKAYVGNFGFDRAPVQDRGIARNAPG